MSARSRRLDVELDEGEWIREGFGTGGSGFSKSWAQAVCCATPPSGWLDEEDVNRSGS